MLKIVYQYTQKKKTTGTNLFLEINGDGEDSQNDNKLVIKENGDKLVQNSTLRRCGIVVIGINFYTGLVLYRSQFDPHSLQFTWQVNEPSPGLTHALWRNWWDDWKDTNICSVVVSNGGHHWKQLQHQWWSWLFWDSHSKYTYQSINHTVFFLEAGLTTLLKI